MFCQNCGIEAPTKQVAFYSNIGALVVRFSKSIKGELCKNCINQFFWKYTLTNLFLGWWGVISLIMNPFLIINNVYRYLTSLSLEPVPAGAVPPVLTEEVVTKLQPLTDAILSRINAHEPMDLVMTNIGNQAGVAPAQVMLYVRALAQAAQKKTK